MPAQKSAHITAARSGSRSEEFGGTLRIRPGRCAAPCIHEATTGDGSVLRVQALGEGQVVDEGVPDEGVPPVDQDTRRGRPHHVAGVEVSAHPPRSARRVVALDSCEDVFTRWRVPVFFLHMGDQRIP